MASTFHFKGKVAAESAKQFFVDRNRGAIVKQFNIRLNQ